MPSVKPRKQEAINDCQGSAEGSGLGFVCFVVINPRVFFKCCANNFSIIPWVLDYLVRGLVPITFIEISFVFINFIHFVHFTLSHWFLTILIVVLLLSFGKQYFASFRGYHYANILHRNCLCFTPPPREARRKVAASAAAVAVFTEQKKREKFEKKVSEKKVEDEKAERTVFVSNIPGGTHQNVSGSDLSSK